MFFFSLHGRTLHLSRLLMLFISRLGIPHIPLIYLTFLQHDGIASDGCCRPFVRACLYQASEREHITQLLEQPRQAAVLQAECPVEVALHAAVQGEWERWVGHMKARPKPLVVQEYIAQMHETQQASLQPARSTRGHKLC